MTRHILVPVEFRHLLYWRRDTVATITINRPENRNALGTDTVKALDVANRLLHRRAVVFLISDFETSKNAAAMRVELRRAMRRTNRRHDLIAVQVEDPRERELPDVGIVALEDAEQAGGAQAPRALVAPALPDAEIDGSTQWHE